VRKECADNEWCVAGKDYFPPFLFLDYFGGGGTWRLIHTSRLTLGQGIFLRTTWTALLSCLCAWFCPQAARGQTALLTAADAAKASSNAGRDASCRIIYLGFVGALEPSQNKHSGVVQIGETLRGDEYPDVCAKSYSPYVWTDGLEWLLKHFPAHSGALTTDELQHCPKVILVGHSMGGWAMMSVARRLRSRDIPVELTIQVDSVGITDCTIPRNVRNGAIFHARDVLVPLTTKHLRLEDASRTKVLANITVEGAGHESITRDPRIRELVLRTIANLRAAFLSAPLAID
jgi:pimeloyl-ACP methyl ester carboxylesterase